MGELQAGLLEQAAQSYALWWREAGLLHATDDLPHRWREPQAAPFWQPDRAAAAHSAAPHHKEARAVEPIATKPAAAKPSAPAQSMPQDIGAFLDWLQKDPSQPESSWTGALITPPNLVAQPLLLIVDMPAPDATDPSSLLEASQRRLATAMLAGLGQIASDVPALSLSMRSAPAGVMDEDVQSRLGRRMIHYLGLARPKAAILIGDRTSRAILGKSWSPSAGGLLNIDHHGGTTNLVTLPGFEMLMSRPAAKARSWQTLRLLHGILN